jgi:1,4-alpha-glucan branching enzyme
MKTATIPKLKRNSRPGSPKAAPHTVHLEVTNPAAHQVCLAGSFNDWKPERTEMVPLGGGKWEKDLTLVPGTYEYRLVVDGKWSADPNAEHSVINPFGERNSILTVT